MHLNLMELIKDAKPGTTLRSRGGNRFRYERFVFVKARKNTVNVYCGWTWKQINNIIDAHEAENVICTLTPDKISFKLPPNGAKGFHINNMSAFLSLNLLHDCWTRWSYSENLIHTTDMECCPFAKMEFNWHGKLISPIPKYAQKKYNEWYKGVKGTRNAQSRARYAQQKAEREFKKYEKAGKLDKYPIANVFLIQNAQLRSYAMNAIGLEKVLAPYPVKVVNTETIEGQGKYELVDIQLPSISIYQFGRRAESQPKWCLYLKMTNQSTGEYHLEGVPRKEDSWNNYIPEETVRGALAWRDGEGPERGHGFDSGKEKASQWKYIEPVILT